MIVFDFRDLDTAFMYVIGWCSGVIEPLYESFADIERYVWESTDCHCPCSNET